MHDFFKRHIRASSNSYEVDIDWLSELTVRIVSTPEFAALYARQIGAIPLAIPENIDFGLGDQFNNAMRRFIMSTNTTIAALAASLASLGTKINQTGNLNVTQELSDIQTHLTKLDSDDAGLQGALQGLVDNANGTAPAPTPAPTPEPAPAA